MNFNGTYINLECRHTQILNHNINSSLELVAMIIRVKYLNMQQPSLQHTECQEDFDNVDEAHILYMLRLIFLMIFCKSLRAVIRMLVGFLKFYRSLICLSRCPIFVQTPPCSSYLFYFITFYLV